MAPSIVEYPSEFIQNIFIFQDFVISPTPRSTLEQHKCPKTFSFACENCHFPTTSQFIRMPSDLQASVITQSQAHGFN